MANFLIVYSTTNNKPYEAANWRTVTEKPTLEEAYKVFDIWTHKAINEDNTRDWPIYGKITQVAIFKDRGRDTFTSKPRFYADYRDKRDWALADCVSGLVNAVNSDYTINKQKGE